MTFKSIFFLALMVVNQAAFSTIEAPQSVEKPFVIIIPSFNNEQWYFNNLASVLLQKYDNYRIIYINDASSDNTAQLVQTFLAQYDIHHKCIFIDNKNRLGALANFYNAIHLCEPNEIIIMLDGDDWLAHEFVITHLNEEYQDPNVWITYGQFMEYPSNRLGGARQLPEVVITKHAYREYDWVTTHLRTFYAGLFHKIKSEDLKYNGAFFPMAWDLAIMFPILEMAGEHSKFMSEVLYIYNRATPINDNKVNAALQISLDQYIHKLPKYQRISNPL